MVTLLLAGMAFAASDSETDTTHITVNEVALLGLSGSLADFAFTAPEDPGDTLEAPGPDANTYLQYTSTVISGLSRTISASVDTMPLGVTMNITAGAPGGDGDCGEAVVGGVDFTTSSVSGGDIIQSIGSGQTGSGATDGPNLTYTVDFDATSWDELYVSSSTEVVVTFTLTDMPAR